jgi:hypothetical protein
MSRRWTILLVAALTILPFAIARAADDWKSVAQKQKLTAKQIETLARDKLVVTDQSCMQVFSPYVSPDMPLFITSDSVLNAYHILLEESVLQLEQTNAQALPGVLQSLWKNLDSADKPIRGKAELVARAKRHAQIVLGTAIELLSGKPVPADAMTATTIRDEVARVEAAAGQTKPAWLGPPDDPQLLAIDYSRYKPRGFYSQTDELSRYFRAVAWLQSIPFRIQSDEELLAILMLGHASEGVATGPIREFFDAFREFLGDRDDLDLMAAAAAAPPGWALNLDAGELKKVQQSLLAKAAQSPSQVNDQIALPPAPISSFRVLSAYRLPDAVLFQRTTYPHFEYRPLPTGMEVCIALGSAHAVRSLDDPERERVIKVIEKSKPLFSEASLYGDYLCCLSTLFDAPATGGPAFMSGEAWQAKSCTTALAGWAQMRHTWMLQAKQTDVVLCIVDPNNPPGFVEPNPAFFGRLKQLARRTAALLTKTGGHRDDRFLALVQLQGLLEFLEKKHAESGASSNIHRSSTREHFARTTLTRVLGAYIDPQQMRDRDFVAKAIPKVRSALDEVRQRKVGADRYISGMTAARFPLADLWPRLAELSARLQALAEKQLAGAAFTDDERLFIRSYGENLAPLMFHLGDPSEIPRDDVPRIADVAYNPSTGEYLEVGIGRPRIMYLLYPTAKGDVLCRGAVLPYYEFRSPTRLTDGDWMTRLDSPDPLCPPPSVPVSSFDWTSAIAWTAGVVVVCVLGYCIARRRKTRLAQR